MKLNRYGYLIGEGFRNIFTHGFMSFASVTIIIACLIVMGSFTLLDININQIIDDIGDQNQILAYVDEDMEHEFVEQIINQHNHNGRKHFYGETCKRSSRKLHGEV